MSKVWVSRSGSNVAMPIYVIKGSKPTLNGSFWDLNQTNDLMEMHTPGSFKKKYNFTPKKGSCRQYELSLKEIE